MVDPTLSPTLPTLERTSAARFSDKLREAVPSLRKAWVRRSVHNRVPGVIVISQLLGIASLTFLLAFLMRFDFRLGSEHWRLLRHTLPILVAMRGLAFLGFRLHRRWFRFISYPDVLAILGATTVSSALFGLYILWRQEALGFPRSVVLIDWVLQQLLLFGYYSTLRVYEEAWSHAKRHCRRVLVVGEATSVPRALRELKVSDRWLPVGILASNPLTVGTKLLGVPVKATFDHLEEHVRTNAADAVVFITRGIERGRLLELLKTCRRGGIDFVCLDGPSVLPAAAGAGVDNSDIELILQRREIATDTGAVRQLVYDKRVLVTGAGGSIGSELCRQISRFQPATLHLLDRSENNLFFIHREIQQRCPDLRVFPRLADITDGAGLLREFHDASPQAVFHAAAHKHVGMMEQRPWLAIINNVIGTYHAAMAAIASECELFVNISTDKAVNPKSYMGLSKRLAEICIRELSTSTQTRFVTVRFGNVAGSTGSVIQLFRQQIQRGEHLTVTDRHATRFFMSISEAVQLVMQAAVIGESGAVLVLDTGESVNIYELARTMISLAGYVPDVDIPICFTGLLDAEKLTEELFDPTEPLERVSQGRIVVVHPGENRHGNLLHRIERWKHLAAAGAFAELLTEVRDVWPDFPHRIPEGTPTVPQLAAGSPLTLSASRGLARRSVRLVGPEAK